MSPTPAFSCNEHVTVEIMEKPQRGGWDTQASGGGLSDLPRSSGGPLATLGAGRSDSIAGFSAL